MTPLAHLMMKDLHLQDTRGRQTVLALLADVHCFECSAITEVANDLCGKFNDPNYLRQMLDFIFLPAPNTWLEWREGSARLGWSLRQIGDDPSGDIKISVVAKEKRHDTSTVVDFGLLNAARKLAINQEAFQALGGSELIVKMLRRMYAFLCLINTPKHIGRRQFMPHAGLQRELLRNQKLVGKFPLHAWTEILLSVQPPRDMSDDPAQEAWLTGRKCLHFCRSHLRIRNGAIEFVKSHWRGDPALGMKQSRYTVTP